MKTSIFMFFTVFSFAVLAQDIQDFKSDGEELTSYNCDVVFDSAERNKEIIEDDRIDMSRHYHLRATSATEAVVAAEARAQAFIDVLQVTKSIVLSSYASDLKSVANGNIKSAKCMEAGVWE